MQSLRQAGLVDPHNRIVIFPHLTSIDMHKCILANVIHILTVGGSSSILTDNTLDCIDITDKLSFADQKEHGSRRLILEYRKNIRSAFTK